MFRQPLVYDVPTALTPTEKKKVKEFIQRETQAKLKRVATEAIEYKQKLIKAATKKNKGAPLTSEQVHEIEAKVREFRKQMREEIKQEYDHSLKTAESDLLYAKKQQAITDAKQAHSAKVEEYMIENYDKLFPLDPIHMVGKALVAGICKIENMTKAKRSRSTTPDKSKHTR